MKLHALLIAAALAFAGTAFAQTGGSAGASGSTPAATAADKAAGHAHKKKVTKVKAKAGAKKGHAHQHAAAMRHHGHHDARAMGAGALSPVTDLDARARQERIDRAYDQWLRLQGRR